MERPMDRRSLHEEGHDVVLALVKDTAEVLEDGHAQGDALHGLIDVRVEDAGWVQEAFSAVDEEVADLLE